MAQPIMLPSFAAGELSPSLFARVDMAKYHSGASVLRNFFVDYRGGASTRAGTALVARAKDSANPVRVIRSVFNAQQAYALEFGQNYMRVIRNGAYVLEPLIGISAVVQANPGLFITASNHGYIPGQAVFLGGGFGGMPTLNAQQYLIATTPAPVSFTLTDLDGNPINTAALPAFFGPGTVGRIFTLATPYAAADLALLKWAQSNSVMTLTHPNYKAQVLTRIQDYAWTIVPLAFTSGQVSPAAPTVTPNTAGTTSYNYKVTTISADFKQESLASPAGSTALGATMSITATAFNTVAWAAVAGAGGYNVYRQLEVPGGTSSAGSAFGFVGFTQTNAFNDHNIAPDFTLVPPQGNDPFNNGAIVSVPVTAAGTGYLTEPDTEIIITDTTGFGGSVLPVIVGGGVDHTTVFNGGANYHAPTFLARTRVGTNGLVQIASTGGGGTILALLITKPGTNYATNVTWQSKLGPTFGAGTFSVDSSGAIIGYAITTVGAANLNGDVVVIVQTQVGAGATFGAAVLSNAGNNPGCVTYYQGRQIFAGANSNPDNVWGTQTGDFFNMNFSNPTRDTDAFSVGLVSQESNIIKWLVPMNALIVLTARNAWRIDGGSQSDVITPTTFNATPQSFTGAADVPPIPINYDVLYVQARGSVVRDLAYDFYLNVYTGNDVSVLSNHLFSGHQILEWGYAEEPFKIIWCVREDGVLLAFTYLKSQEVYAWTRHDTQGLFKSVCTVPEGQEDAVYFVVQRVINGQNVNFIERMASRNFGTDLSRAWCVDCALQAPLTFPTANATPSAASSSPGIYGYDLINGGAGYSAGTTIAITDANNGPGVGATAVPTIAGGVITGITPGAPGQGYLRPVVTFVDPANTGSGAVAQAIVQNRITLTADAAVFAAPNVGNVVRMNGCIATVVVFTDTQHVTLNLLIPLASAATAPTGTWSMTAPFTTVLGLGYLNGQTVVGLADGNLIPATVVANGQIVLPEAATLVTLGLSYQAQLLSMAIDTQTSPTNQGKRAKVTAVTLRVKDTRGLKVGYDLGSADMKRIKQVANTVPNLPPPMVTGDERIIIPPIWKNPGQVAAQQDDPLPATILGLIPEIQIGDTP